MDTVQYYPNNQWSASNGALQGPLVSITAAQVSSANLFAYLCTNLTYGTVGLGWMGSVCGPSNWRSYQASISQKLDTVVGTSMVVAHEMGHNLGMYHDFDATHGGPGNPCDGTGIKIGRAHV